MTEAAPVAVIGGGLMGAGIAAVFACAGHPVHVCEPSDDVRGTLEQRVREATRLLGANESCAQRVRATHELTRAVAQAEFVFEAVPERIPLKRAVFAELSAYAPAHAILASNTSVIPIGKIAEGQAAAERIVGTHWWNPPHLIPLVEVVQSPYSLEHAVSATMELLRSVGKAPAHVRKDVPGFIANRLQHAMWREAIAMVADGVCDARTLDECVKNSFGLRLSVLGPLENADLVGLDLTLDIHDTIIPELDRSDAPHAYLRERVAAGALGCKTGVGFRSWSADEVTQLRDELSRRLTRARDERRR